MWGFVEDPFDFHKGIVDQCVDFVVSGEELIHQLVVPVFDVLQQRIGLPCFFGVGFDDLFEQIGRFAHSGDDNHKGVIRIGLQDLSYVFDSCGVFDGSAAKFEDFERFFHRMAIRGSGSPFPVVSV